ncbi:hypothetical protein V492_01313 [Pseudogymnoascus sp. VKM F-4246]|nr:hypothetical protein V492_01313 [Pseudogymnoascus sp. VKM F-4246]
MPRPRTHDSENCWMGVTDPKKRKQIQDRLAQRARRQRLATRHRSTSSNNSSARSATCAQDSTNSAAAAHQVPPAGALPQALSIPRHVISQTPAPVLDSAPNLHLDVPPTVYAALFTNGLILSIPCACASPAPTRSPPCPEAPPDLQPTALQLSTPHARWIDRFPFPLMRDNFILMTVGGGVGAAEMEVLDQEAFLGDLFCMESFVLKEGGKAWEGADWTLGKEFQERWGWLFY